jgi:hypothetical protein
MEVGPELDRATVVAVTEECWAQIFAETGVVLPTVQWTETAQRGLRLHIADHCTEIMQASEQATGLLSSAARELEPVARNLLSEGSREQLAKLLVTGWRRPAGSGRLHRVFDQVGAFVLLALGASESQIAAFDRERSDLRSGDIADKLRSEVRRRLDSFVSIQLVEHYLAQLESSEPKLTEICRGVCGLPAVASLLAERVRGGKSLSGIAFILNEQIAALANLSDLGDAPTGTLAADY